MPGSGFPIVSLLRTTKINPSSAEPICQLFKCQDRIDRAEYLSSPIASCFFAIHGTKNTTFTSDPYIFLIYLPWATIGDTRRRYILRAVGIIFFDRPGHLDSIGNGNSWHLIFPHKFLYDHLSQEPPFRSLSHLIKSKFQKRVHDLPRLIKIKNSRIGRSDRYDRFKPLCQISFHSFQIACKCFAFCGQTSRQRPQLIQ